MVHVRLQHLQWVGGAAVAACCLLLGGATLFASLDDYARYRTGLSELDRFHRVLAAADAVTAERPPSNSAMLATPDQLAAAAGELAARRVETDRLLDEAELQFAGPEDEKRRASVVETRARLQLARGKVDAVAQRYELRGGSRLFDAIEALYAAADAGEEMRDAFGREVIARTPQISTEIFLGMTASRLREQAGRVGSHLVMMLTANKADDDAIFARLLETTGRLDALGDVMRNYAGAVFPGGEVDAAMKRLDKVYFNEALPFALLTAQSDAKRNTMSVAEFRSRFTPSLKSAEALRDLIVASSHAKFAERRNGAAVNVFVTATLTGIVWLILLITAVLFRRSLFGPLMRARDEVVAIARGDLSEPAATRRLSREIREMFEGLSVLRAEQLHKLELERDQLRMASELRQLSETDALTRLLNRRAIEAAAVRAFEEADASGGALALVMFDVDHFKSVNDAHGHAIGDLVLKKIGQTLAPLVRPHDSFARFGGEEFLVLLVGAELEIAGAVAERLRRRLAETVMSAELKLKVTGSFGVAAREPGSDLSWDAFVAAADRRLYAAKKAGRNRVVSSDGPTEGAGAVA